MRPNENNGQRNCKHCNNCTLWRLMTSILSTILVTALFAWFSIIKDMPNADDITELKQQMEKLGERITTLKDEDMSELREEIGDLKLELAERKKG